MADMIGKDMGEIPGVSFDPFDLLKLHDIAPTVFPHAKWLRESELKHARAAMLATVGVFASQIGPTIPGYTSVADPVENLNKFALEHPLGLAQIVLAIGIIEGHFFPGDFWFGKGDREAGNLGYDPLGMSRNKPKATQDDLQLKELRNGRLAMMAMAAFASEHWIPDSVPFGFKALGFSG